MDWLPQDLTNAAFWSAMTITGFSGFVKGAVGFAMPMLMISAFSSFLPPDQALAGLILPTLFTNISQSLRQGLRPALMTARRYHRFLIARLFRLVVSAQFVAVIPQALFLRLPGAPITALPRWNWQRRASRSNGSIATAQNRLSGRSAGFMAVCRASGARRCWWFCCPWAWNRSGGCGCRA